jgi:hypothetical protein
VDDDARNVPLAGAPSEDRDLPPGETLIPPPPPPPPPPFILPSMIFDRLLGRTVSGAGFDDSNADYNDSGNLDIGDAIQCPYQVYP